MDNELKQALQSLERLAKNNYTNLNERMQKMEYYVQQAFDKLETWVREIQQEHKVDHDKIIKIENKVATQQDSFAKFEEREKYYGIKVDKRIDAIETTLEKSINASMNNKLSLWKIMGMMLGVGATVGIIMSIIFFTITKVLGG